MKVFHMNGMPMSKHNQTETAIQYRDQRVVVRGEGVWGVNETGKGN